MAERIHWWTERCLGSPLFLSLSLTIYPPTNLSSMYLSIYRPIYFSLSLSFIYYLSIYLSTYLSIHLSIYLSTYLSIYLSLSLSLRLSIYLFIYLSISLSIHLSLYLSVYLSNYLFSLSICLSVYLSICLSVYLPLYLSMLVSNYPSLNLCICLSISLSLHLSIYLSICLSIYLPIYLSVYLSMYLSVHLSIYLSVCLSIYSLSIYLSIYLSFFLSIYLSIYLCIYLSVYLSIYLSVHLSIYLSARSKTKKPWKMHLCRSSSNVPSLPWFGNATKPSRFAHSWQSAQSLAPATRNDIWTSKSAANIWCFVHFHFDMCFAPQRRALFPHRNFQKWSVHGVFCTFWLRNALRATTACTFSISQLPKVVRNWFVLYILTSTCASRQNGVHFFDISTSKSAPRRRCVLYILTSKCASRHNGVQFFISHLARWLRTRRFSEPTFRPSGATNHWKNTVFRDFPTFSRICIFCLLTLSLLPFFLLIFLFSLPLPCSAFHLSILSEVWLLNFLRSYHWNFRHRLVRHYW